MDYITRYPKPMCRCTDPPALLYVRFTGCRATGKLQSGVGPRLSLFLCVCIPGIPSLLAVIPSDCLNIFGCNVCLSIFRYVSADFVFTIHNFTEFIILSLKLVYRPFL